MSTILFISGTTRGDALGCIIRGIAKNFERLGFETIEVNLMKEMFSNLSKQPCARRMCCSLSRMLALAAIF